MNRLERKLALLVAMMRDQRERVTMIESMGTALASEDLGFSWDEWRDACGMTHDERRSIGKHKNFRYVA